MIDLALTVAAMTEPITQKIEAAMAALSWSVL